MKKKYRAMTMEEFKGLKKGDTFWGRCNNLYTKCTAEADAFYNIDADEPDWEIQDKGGCSYCWDSVYVMVRKKKKVILVSVTDRDIKAVKHKNAKAAKRSMLEELNSARTQEGLKEIPEEALDEGHEDDVSGINCDGMGAYATVGKKNYDWKIVAP